ncbi:SRPBCC family protein [Sinomonas halotolerans]|uniref:SRPBCC family protein n=1 Tax=Sinomonas halotolerans TaxID=1644133 RepID=A0ABU9X3H0_9MICC
MSSDDAATVPRPTRITAVPGGPHIDVVRDFDAPPERVFAAHCDPALFSQWIGPARLITVVEHMDARTGGSYRFVQREHDGGEYRFRGSFHEVAAPHRIVMTFEYEGAPGHVELDTASFSDLPDGRCRLRVHSTFESAKERDAVLAAGMADGVEEGYRRLDGLLADGIA